MNLETVGEQLRSAYRDVMPRYRHDDEIEVQTANHRRIWNVLRRICTSFPYPIAVLDAGCGTGRYFHCLVNVDRLTGLDVSPEMLRGAEHPVLHEQVTATRVELVCENIFRASFAAGSFDFIYSFGMFGNGCPVTAEICDRFFEWLRPGGKLLFDALSARSLPMGIRARRTARALTYPWLPGPIRRRLDQREARHPLFALTEGDLHRIMRASRFTEFHISRQECESPLWIGGRLECLARRTN